MSFTPKHLRTVLPLRPNKTAAGICFTQQRQKNMGKHRIKNNVLYDQEDKVIVLRLSMRGSCDVLASNWLLCHRVKVEHPIDKGYFKEAYVLTKQGKARLDLYRKGRKPLCYWKDLKSPMFSK